MSFDFNSFLEQLEKDTTPKERKQTGGYNDIPKAEKLTKVYMSTPDSFGTIYGVPMVTDSGSPAVSVSGVKEVKLTLNEDDKFARWVRILPQNFYKFEPGSKEEALYGEVVSLHDRLVKEEVSWKLVRNRNYFLTYLYVLKHKNLAGEIPNESCPCLFIFDHNRAAQAFQAEIKAKSELAGGGFNWTQKFFTNEINDRKGLMIINYYKDKGVWTSTVNLASITEDHYGLTNGQPSVNIPEASAKVFHDPVNDLLGVSKADDRFDYDFYVKVKAKMQEMLGNAANLVEPSHQSFSAPQQVTTTPTPPVNNEDAPF